MKKLLGTAVGVLAGLAFGVSLDGWGGTGNGASERAVKAKPLAAVDVIELSPDIAKRARVVVETAKNEQLAPTLRMVGSVNFDQEALSEVGARIDGQVAKLLVSLGDDVEVGAPLVEIESAELGAAAATLLGVRANLIAAEHAEARESSLLKQQLSSAAIVERTRAQVRGLRAELEGAEQRLLTMGFTPAEIKRIQEGTGPRRVTLRATVAGQVVARKAVLGQVVDPTQTILRIANLDRVWVELDAFERDLGRVAEGNSVEIESETHPGITFYGRVTYVDATVDMATRTAHLRVEVDNTKRLLRPGQFVNARLATTGQAAQVLSVPRSAVLQVEGEPSVFTVVGPGRYVARPVELGAHAGERVAVVRGLMAGDRIVTQGAFALKSELLR